MSLLGPLFLVALPLVGLPILLHFYRGRQVDTVEWGAMHFLVDAVSDGRRWEKLEELLLMLLRVAAIAALIFALAQPLVRGSWLGAHATRDVILVIDDSLSTAVEIDGESVSNLLREQAAEIIDDLSAEDHVQLLAAAGGGRWITRDPISATSLGKRQLLELIEGLKPTEGDAAILDCLQIAARLDPTEGSTARLLVVVSDGQAQTLTPQDSEAWNAWSGVVSNAEPPISVSVLDCGLGDAVPGNLAIGNVSASRTVVRKGETINLSADIANFGDQQSGDIVVEWKVADRLIASSKVNSLSVGEIGQTKASTKVDWNGPQPVTATLAAAHDDALVLDNTATIVIEASEREPILIVEDTTADITLSEDQEAGRIIPASQHLMASLGYLNGKPQAWHSVYEPQVVDAAGLAAANLADYRAVVIVTPGVIDASEIDRLQGYVAVGGGVWLTLDGSVDAERFNALWHDEGEGLVPLAVDELTSAGRDADISDSPEEGIAIHPPGADHPATRNLANTTQLDIDKARLARHWMLAEPAESNEEALSVLLASERGDPLVVERYFGRGRVILQTFPLQLGWSNLPVRKAFVAMVHDWLDYLAAPLEGRHNLTAGTPIVAQPPASEGDTLSTEVTAQLTIPSGEEIALVPRGDLAAPVFRYTQTTLPGLYQVEFGEGASEKRNLTYHTARSLEESRLQPISATDQELLTEDYNVRFNDQLESEVTETSGSDQLAPFWWMLLAGLIGLLVIESILASRISWNRMGDAVPVS